jgi:hypothetical protein
VLPFHVRVSSSPEYGDEPISHLNFSATFSIYMQLWMMITLFLLFIVNINYMIQPNWSSSSAQDGLSR